jgi:hypothetical protein
MEGKVKEFIGEREILTLSKTKNTIRVYITELVRGYNRISYLLRRTIPLIFYMIAFSGLGVAQSVATLMAVDDTLRTGPLQSVRKDIIKNDTIAGSHYEWQIISSSLSSSVGKATQEGDYLIFAPAVNCRDTAFTILYELSGNNIKDTAKVHIIVSRYNKPVNIIDEGVACYENMPANINFGIHRKFPIYSSVTSYTPPNGWVDGYTSPLVGDLTGDGKPEIVIAGNNNLIREGNRFTVHSINIYNGQTGNLMCKYMINNSKGLNWNYFIIGDEFHRAPSIFALADLDNDGLGEIVICNVENGKVAALKPVVTDHQITDLDVMWRGTDRNGAVMSYKAPLSSTGRDVYGYPNPYIADLDADGTPEIIIYNKIFNGKTGRLVMSWRGSALTAKASSYGGSKEDSESADDTDLEALNYANPVSSSSATNIKKQP